MPSSDPGTPGVNGRVQDNWYTQWVVPHGDLIPLRPPSLPPLATPPPGMFPGQAEHALASGSLNPHAHFRSRSNSTSPGQSAFPGHLA